ncbi:MAG TPA: hypothetical protein VHZ53_01385 [Steroidobacteraceae bacterium]|jgi:hypothetical protein|nr:hypothetical protein [Steroidobacteraceae bacterium]
MRVAESSNYTLQAHGRRNRCLPRAAAAGVSIALCFSVLLSGCDISDNSDSTNKVNGSVHVPAGKPATAVSTVNGSIHIADTATVTSATTVNGSIHVGDHATATLLNTVNGSITLGKGAQVSGAINAVNGEMDLAEGADVAGALSNVNGKITITGAHVGGGIKTVDASMSITGASKIEGGILVQKPSNELLHFGEDVPRIVIGPGATVQGDLKFERKVDLYVSDKATIGTVIGATAMTYSGDLPPK